jgi:hypothetical protein
MCKARINRDFLEVGTFRYFPENGSPSALPRELQILHSDYFLEEHQAICVFKGDCITYGSYKLNVKHYLHQFDTS